MKPDEQLDPEVGGEVGRAVQMLAWARCWPRSKKTMLPAT